MVAPRHRQVDRQGHVHYRSPGPVEPRSRRCQAPTFVANSCIQWYVPSLIFNNWQQQAPTSWAAGVGHERCGCDKTKSLALERGAGAYSRRCRKPEHWPSPQQSRRFAMITPGVAATPGRLFRPTPSVPPAHRQKSSWSRATHWTTDLWQPTSGASTALSWAPGVRSLPMGLVFIQPSSIWTQDHSRRGRADHCIIGS
jgi:hypothetical protein